LLPDTSTNTGATFVDGTVGNGVGVKGNWGMNDESELGALSYVPHAQSLKVWLMNRKYLGELGVPALPGGFLDVLTYFSRNDNNNNDMGTIQMSELTNQAPPQTLQQAQGQGQGNISSNTSQLYGNGSSAGTGNFKPTSNGAKKITSQDKGKGKETTPVNPLNISGMSRMYVHFRATGSG
jgi:hypothetical protein